MIANHNYTAVSPTVIEGEKCWIKYRLKEETPELLIWAVPRALPSLRAAADAFAAIDEDYPERVRNLKWELLDSTLDRISKLKKWQETHNWTIGWNDVHRDADENSDLWTAAMDYTSQARAAHPTLPADDEITQAIHEFFCDEVESIRMAEKRNSL